MADPTSKLITVRPNMATTLASPMTASDTSASFNNLGAYTTGDRVLLTIDAHDSAGTATPSTRELVYGEVSTGNTLINMVRAVEGSAQSHTAGAEVIDEVTAAHHRLMHDGLDSEHTATGAHDTALVAMLAGAQTFTGPKTFTGALTMPDSTVTTAKLADGAATPAKIALGTTTSYVATSESTTSATYVALATAQAVTVTIPSTGKALLIVTAISRNTTAGTVQYIGVDISGANTSTLGTLLNTRYETGMLNSQFGHIGFMRYLTGFAAGSTTFTLRFASSSGTSTFMNREITVVPIG